MKTRINCLFSIETLKDLDRIIKDMQKREFKAVTRPDVIRLAVEQFIERRLEK